MVLRAKSRDSSSRPAWVERAPQQPCFGCDDLAALRGEDADGGGVDRGEEDPLHAASQDTYPAALLADRARNFRDLLFLRQVRQERLHRAHPGRDALHDAGFAQLVPDAEALVETHRGRR